MNEEKKHYSERLQRDFHDGDYLSIQEVRLVLAANRGSDISMDVTSATIRRHNVRNITINSRVKLYLYDDLKSLVVPLVRGRAASPSPTAGAQRQRAFRERQRQKKADQSQDDHAPAFA